MKLDVSHVETKVPGYANQTELGGLLRFAQLLSPLISSKSASLVPDCLGSIRQSSGSAADGELVKLAKCPGKTAGTKRWRESRGGAKSARDESTKKEGRTSEEEAFDGGLGRAPR